MKKNIIKIDTLQALNVKGVQELNARSKKSMNQTSVHAKSAKPANSETDFIPDSVYCNLPELLRAACDVFSARNERDVFLTGALSVLGGCFNGLYAYNTEDKKSVAANLMSFIIAPPASGKGALKYARKLANEIRFTFSRRDDSERSRVPRKLLIPADISSAGLVEILQQNDGAGVMIESEIDTLVNATKQDWGNYSDILRNSFENETCSFYRKKNKQYIEIENLKLSLAISGTVEQFKHLMVSSENGLFSRGCYYTFKNEDEKLQCIGRLNTTMDIEEQFAEYAITANSYYENLMEFGFVGVLFSQEQLLRIQEVLQADFDQIYQVENLHANVKRAFIIVQKIATILSFLFRCQKEEVEESFSCDDVALQMAIELGTVYLRHAYKAFEFLPKQHKGELNVNQERLLAILPDTTFARIEAVELAKGIGIKARTADGIINYLKSREIIISMGHGKFRKAA